MESSTGTRIWRAYKEANRPWPQLDDDDVIDFMITEAIAVKVAKEDQDEDRKQETKKWKKDKEGLNKLRDMAAGVSL